MSWNWQEFCGHNDNFTLWINNDFGYCFEQIMFKCPAYICMIIICSYHIAQSGGVCRTSQQGYKRPWFLVIRLICSIVLMFLPIVEICVRRYLMEVNLGITDYIVYGLTCSAWILHTVFIRNIDYMYDVELRGSFYVSISLILVTVSEAIHMRSIIIKPVNHFVAFSEADVYFSIIYLGSFFILFVMLVFKPSHPCDYDLFCASSNGSSSSTQHLVQDSQKINLYGSATFTSSEMLVGEKGANCFSWLTFQWVHTLLVRGSSGHIGGINDIFMLPARLDTVKLEKDFCDLFKGKGPIVQDIQNAMNDQYTVYCSAGQSKPKSLLWALNKAYGCEYYSLGILKLLADVFGFIGPLLLNKLVTFIDEKREPGYKGCLYASGLVLSTFFSSICSTQFDYNSQVILLSAYLILLMCMFSA